ncbi:hypothetical protein HO133_003875 [Letharia lupina]|uniref:Uncharacterized protein n=1 Tax=Letharia lupina TaxID=560253 RepID=A0A8H6CAK5_9LECA|nr:uncharacterized protein HO133_003875 [Letharia lupina]KAF6220050.1 hypothetical protein HO133_003875 [Letharia lupina]
MPYSRFRIRLPEGDARSRATLIIYADGLRQPTITTASTGKPNQSHLTSIVSKSAACFPGTLRLLPPPLLPPPLLAADVDEDGADDREEDDVRSGRSLGRAVAASVETSSVDEVVREDDIAVATEELEDVVGKCSEVGDTDDEEVDVEEEEEGVEGAALDAL